MQNSPTRLGDLTAMVAREKQRAEIADYLMAKALRIPVPASSARIEKAAITAIESGDVGSRQETQAYAELIDRQTVPGQVRTLMINAPPFAAIQAMTDEPSAAWVGEGLPIPLARASFTTYRTAPTKLATLIAFSKETLRLGDPEAQTLVTRRAADHMVRAINTAFLGADAASDAQPAGLLYNVAATDGGSPASLDTALERLYASVVDGRAARPVFVTSGRAALSLLGTDLALFRDVKLTDGTIGGAVLLIAAEAGNKLILFDANQIAHYDGGLEVDRSEIDSIQMTDTPTPGATSVVSGFQTNFVTVRLIRYTHWLKLRDDAAGYLELGFDVSPA